MQRRAVPQVAPQAGLIGHCGILGGTVLHRRFIDVSHRMWAHPPPPDAPKDEPAATPGCKLHLGCGTVIAPGWLNCDVRELSGLDLRADLRKGLPFDARSLDCIVAIHVLQDLAYKEIYPTLLELRRVLKRGGVLRLALPDLDKAMRAYFSGDKSYFVVPDADARSVGAKLVTQLVWYGSIRTPFTFDFAEEALLQAGFRDVRRCGYRVTHSRHSDLASLDNRQRESLFVEATR